MHALRSPASGWMYARPSLILRPRAPWADMVSWAVSLVRSQRFGIDAIVPQGCCGAALECRGGRMMRYDGLVARLALWWACRHLCNRAG